MTSRKIRVLVVDDTVLYRKILSDILARIPDVEVVGTANNGRIALAKIDQLKPDLLTLDFEMPEMDGLTTLRELQRLKLDVAVVMVSAHTSEGAAVTIKALEGGAFDFITKPDSTSLEQNRESLLRQLRPVMQSVSTRKLLRSTLSGARAPSSPRPAPPVRPAAAGMQAKPPGTSPAGQPPRIVAAAPVRQDCHCRHRRVNRRPQRPGGSHSETVAHLPGAGGHCPAYAAGIHQGPG